MEEAPVSTQAPNLVIAMKQLASKAAMTALVPPSALTGEILPDHAACGLRASSENASLSQTWRRSSLDAAPKAAGKVDRRKHARLQQGGIPLDVGPRPVCDGANAYIVAFGCRDQALMIRTDQALGVSI